MTGYKVRHQGTSDFLATLSKQHEETEFVEGWNAERAMVFETEEEALRIVAVVESIDGVYCVVEVVGRDS